jgi:hypothetical protein
MFIIDNNCNVKSLMLNAMPNMIKFIGMPIIDPHVNILRNSVPTKYIGATLWKTILLVDEDNTDGFHLAQKCIH